MADKTSRPSFNDYILDICHAVSKRSTCRHRDQGAVIVKGKRIISTGYNGAPSGVKDCLELGFCAKAEGEAIGEAGLCRAEGLHGESNAIISAAKAGISINRTIMYCIYSPCILCCNMIKNAGIVKVFYENVYSGFPIGPQYLEANLGIPTEQITRSKES